MIDQDSVRLGSRLGFTRLNSIDRVPYEQAFLIEDLLTSRITFLAGEPKAGKSLLVAGLVRALLEGHEEFLGLRVMRQVKTVAYCFTDDGAQEELRERFEGTSALHGVHVLAGHGRNDQFWSELPFEVAAIGAELFVLDTVVGSLGSGEDIASGLTAQAVMERVRPIAEAGVPVLLVTHTPKGQGEGLSVASSVMGGRALAGGARGVIALRKSKKDGLVLETQINRARRDLSLRVAVERAAPDSEVPVWSRRERAEGKRRTRSAVILDRNGALADLILREQPEEDSLVGLAQRYAPSDGRSANTLRARLRDLVLHDGTGWVRREPLTGVAEPVAA